MSDIEAAWHAFWRELAAMGRDIGDFLADLSLVERIFLASVAIVFLIGLFGPHRREQGEASGRGSALPVLIAIVIVTVFGATYFSSLMPGWSGLTNWLA